MVYSFDPVKYFFLLFLLCCCSACNCKDHIRNICTVTSIAVMYECVYVSKYVCMCHVNDSNRFFTAKMSVLPSWTIQGWDQTFDTKSCKFNIRIISWLLKSMNKWITAQLGPGDTVEIMITILIQLIRSVEICHKMKNGCQISYKIIKSMCKALNCPNVMY